MDFVSNMTHSELEQFARVIIEYHQNEVFCEFVGAVFGFVLGILVNIY